MRRIHFSINYGGFVGCDEDYYVDVEYDATEEEIADAVQEEFESIVLDNCSWEIEGEEDAP